MICICFTDSSDNVQWLQSSGYNTYLPREVKLELHDGMKSS
jgi:hypothetical protein